MAMESNFLVPNGTFLVALLAFLLAALLLGTIVWLVVRSARR